MRAKLESHQKPIFKKPRLLDPIDVLSKVEGYTLMKEILDDCKSKPSYFEFVPVCSPFVDGVSITMKLHDGFTAFIVK